MSKSRSISIQYRARKSRQYHNDGLSECSSGSYISGRMGAYSIVSPAPFTDVRNAADGSTATSSQSADTGVLESCGCGGPAAEDDYGVKRAFLLFNTSAIGGTQQIDSAALSVYVPNSSYLTNRLNDGYDYVAAHRERILPRPLIW